MLDLIGRQQERRLPDGLLQGQVESESSYLVGNYTEPYENSTRDLGLVMLHKAVTEENCRVAFDGPARVAQLANFLRTRHDLYYGQIGAKTHRRAWELAAGAWNAPAWADTLARGGTLKPEQLTHITEYIGRVTVYAVWGD